jgi:hypothetical protein
LLHRIPILIFNIAVLFGLVLKFGNLALVVMDTGMLHDLDVPQTAD